MVCICVSDLPEREVQVSFLDVGQGDSIFVRTPDDYFILIDGGPSVSVLEELAEVMPRYNRTIDLILLTHPHADHVNGLVEVVKRFEVKGVLLVGTPSSNPFYAELLRLCKDLNIPVYFGESGRDLKVGSYLYIDVIWPFRSMAGAEFENLNNASLAVRLITPNKVFMLTGDAEEEQEGKILESGFDLSTDIFKAGHHGSKTASSDEFLDAIDPHTVVIQSGAGNSFGHPHVEVLERLLKRALQVRRNDLEGRVKIGEEGGP